MPRSSVVIASDENTAPVGHLGAGLKSKKLSGFGLTTKMQANEQGKSGKAARKGLGGTSASNCPLKKKRKLTQPKEFSFATDERLGPAKVRVYSPPPKDTTDEDLIQAAAKVHKEGEITMAVDFHFATDERITSSSKEETAVEFVPLVNQVSQFWNSQMPEESEKEACTGITVAKLPKLRNQGMLEERAYGEEFEPSVIQVQKFWGTLKQLDQDMLITNTSNKAMNSSMTCTIPKPLNLTHDGDKRMNSELSTDERIELELQKKRMEKAQKLRAAQRMR